MDKTFNGQINISRDLRKNKQTVIGKYDVTDIVFLILGFGVAFIVAYLLGFFPFHIVDEFTAIIIAIFPMLIIISLGFRRVAGLRQFNYLMMKYIDKKTITRTNRKIDIRQNEDKYIVGIEIDRRFVNKYINKFLHYENLIALQVRFVKDYETQTNKIYILLNLQYKENDDILADLIDKFYNDNKLKHLSNNDIYSLEDDLRLRFVTKNIRKDKIDMIKRKIFINLFCKHLEHEIDDKVKQKQIIYDKYKGKNYKIYMLNLYDNKVYKKFINKVKRYCDVICYFKRDGKTKYVNTFLLIEDEHKIGRKSTKLEKIDKLSNEYCIIIDKLNKEQYTALKAISYYMINPFNAYRIYK